MSDPHETYMERALSLARRGVGKTSPNPAVGCVIVKDGVIVGEGWHRRAGTPHAEAHALAAAGSLAEGADVYVTLEPCSHYGKTPPCAEALIGSRVGRVFAGMVDPNPKVSGRGIGLLRAAGIETVVGVLEEKCRLLNEAFTKHVTTGLPFVTFKAALTLDGKIATCSGDSKWITNEKSRQYVHRLRSTVDAIMVGAGTVAADDPLLTSRIPGGRDPLRVVVSSRLSIDRTARIFSVTSSAPTILATSAADPAETAPFAFTGVEVLTCSEHGGRVDLVDLFRRLGDRGVQSVLLEGGGTLAGDAFRRGLIDKCLFFYAPKCTGGDGPGPFSGAGVERMNEAVPLRDVRVRRFGADILVEGYPEVACLPD